jgi:signal recognition particle receptor subunit beta
LATVDFQQREITVKIAYFGPTKAGCGTNVRQLHRVQPAREKAELRRVGGENKHSRIWSFAYHPDDRPQITGFDLQVQVCSIPSGDDVRVDRDPSFEGVDGLVFVADARSNRTDENHAAMLDLERCLERHGLDVAMVPFVIQVNQTDAPNARPAARVAQELDPLGRPHFNAMARQGKGVLETHDAILAATLSRIRDNLTGNRTNVTLTALTPARRERYLRAIAHHARALPQAGRPLPRTLSIRPATVVNVEAEELRNARLLHVVRSDITGDAVRVEAIVRRDDGVHRKMALVVSPTSDDTRPISSGTSTPSSAQPTKSAPPENSLHQLVYGFVGLFGGGLSGFLLGYIFFG